MQVDRIRIGSRGSPLAIAQAREVKRRLMAAHGLPDDAVEIRTFTTTGDRIQSRPLSEAGGKGLFTKELEEALLANEIELAVHSMKDMPTELPDGLTIASMLPREDVRDAFVSLRHGSISELPAGAVVGSSSLRRQAQVRRLRPDLQVIEFRGNVETRLRKLEEGVAEATFLACAGLKRLGQSNRITKVMEADEMLPAVAQGAIGIEICSDNREAARLVAAINHEPTWICVETERAFLAELEGSCRTPIAALAELHDGAMRFRGLILTPDGSQCHETERQGPASDARAMGNDAGRELRALAGPEFFQWLT